MKRKVLYMFIVAAAVVLAANGALADVLDVGQANYVNGGHSSWTPETGIFKVNAAGNYWAEVLNWKREFLPNTRYQVTIVGSFPQPVTLQMQKDVDSWTDYGSIRFWGQGALKVDIITNSLASPDSRITLGLGQLPGDYVIKSISIETPPPSDELLLSLAKAYFAKAGTGSWNPATGQFELSLITQNYWDANLNWDIALIPGNYLLGIDGVSEAACKLQLEVKDAEDLAKKPYATAEIMLNGKTSFAFTSSVKDDTARLVFNFGSCPCTHTINSVKFFALLNEVANFKAVPSHESIFLSWEKMAGASSYEVFGKKLGDWVRLGSVSENYTTVGNLEPGKSYEFKVVALDTLAKSQGVTLTASTVPWIGDLNGDLVVDLKDALLALKVMQTHDRQPVKVESKAFVKGGKLGLQDAVYILQKISGLRE